MRLRNLGQKCALATIVEVRGSIPSFESAKILVREDGSMTGTIGGGCVEAEVWNAAREVIQTEKPKHLNFNLGQDAAYDNGLICNGQLDVFVEPIMPVPHAFIFGAGHISKSLSKVATLAGFNSVVIDNRDTFANRERFPEAVAVHADEYEEVFPRLAINETSYTSSSLAAIATTWSAPTGDRDRGAVHRHDREQTQGPECDPRTRKTRHLARSVPAHSCADGAGHRGDYPEEIAISVTAEMIAVRRNAGSNWRALSLSVFDGTEHTVLS